jgi:hypothetical protein
LQQSHRVGAIHWPFRDIKLGDSSLPQSPVKGGSWIATSVSNGIAATAEQTDACAVPQTIRLPAFVVSDRILVRAVMASARS